MIGHFKEIEYVDINPYTMEPFRTDSLDQRINRLRSFFFGDVDVNANKPSAKTTSDKNWKMPNIEPNVGIVKRAATERPAVGVSREALPKDPRPYSVVSKQSPMNAVSDSNWKIPNLEAKVETIRRTIVERSAISTLPNEVVPKDPKLYSITLKQSPMNVPGDIKWRKSLSEGKIQVARRPIGERPTFSVVPYEGTNKNLNSGKFSFNNSPMNVADNSKLKKLTMGEKMESNKPIQQPTIAAVPNEVVSTSSKPDKTDPKKFMTEVTEDNWKKQKEETASGRVVGKRRAALLLKAKTQYNEGMLKLCRRRISKANKRLCRVSEPTFRKKDETIFERIWREEEEEVKKLLEEYVLKVEAALEAEVEKLPIEECIENEEPTDYFASNGSPLIDVVTVDDESEIQASLSNSYLVYGGAFITSPIQMDHISKSNVEVPLIQSSLMYPQPFSQTVNVAIPYNYHYGPEPVFAYPAWYYDARHIYANNYQIYTNGYRMEANYLVNDNQTDGNYSASNNQMNGNYSTSNTQIDGNYSANKDQIDGNYPATDNQIDGNYPINDNQVDVNSSVPPNDSRDHRNSC